MRHTSNNSKTKEGLTFTQASEPPKANTQNQYYKFHNFPFSKNNFLMCRITQLIKKCL